MDDKQKLAETQPRLRCQDCIPKWKTNCVHEYLQAEAIEFARLVKCGMQATLETQMAARDNMKRRMVSR